MIWYYDIIMILRMNYFNEISEKAQLPCTVQDPALNHFCKLVYCDQT